MENSLTPMQKFALNLLKTEKREINPGYLGNQWFIHKNGGFPPAASRYRFGTTGAAYKTLRKLAELGLINKHISTTTSGFSIEKYSHVKE
jgi:hypothetical protein